MVCNAHSYILKKELCKSEIPKFSIWFLLNLVLRYELNLKCNTVAKQSKV